MIDEPKSEPRPSGTDSGDSAPATKAAGRRTRHVVFTLGTNVGILGINFVTGTANARLLGPSGRGELAAIQNIPAYLGMVALLGLPSAVGYYSARRPEEARSLAVTAAIICLLVSFPAMALGYLVMPWGLSRQPASVIHDARLYLCFIALQALVTMPYLALQGLGKFSIWNVLRVAPNVAMLVAIFAAWLSGELHSGSVARFYLLAYACIGPIVYAALWLKSGPARSHVRRVRELFAYGLPSAMMVPAGLLNLQLDQMMMAAWVPSNMLGFYAVGVSWSSLTSPIFGALGSVIFPTLAAAEDREVQRALVARSFRFAALVAIVLGLGLAAVTPLLFPLLFGASFRPAIPAALILVGAGTILNVNNLCGELLRGLGVPRWTMYGQLLALPVTIGSLVVLLPRWSIVGAGVSSVLAYLIVGAVCLGGLKKTCEFRWGELLPTGADALALSAMARQVLSRPRRGAL